MAARGFTTLSQSYLEMTTNNHSIEESAYCVLLFLEDK